MRSNSDVLLTQDKLYRKYTYTVWSTPTVFSYQKHFKLSYIFLIMRSFIKFIGPNMQFNE